MRFCSFGALGVLCLAVLPACAAEPLGDGYLSRFTWSEGGTAPEVDFGGFSGLEVSQDGQSFVAISDGGAIVAGRITREDGQITGIAAGTLSPLLTPDGKPIVERNRDAEGLAISPAGTRIVSFEGVARIWAYGDKGVTDMPLPPAFAGLARNGGLEALAIDAEGALFAVPERSGALTRPFPVWRLHKGRWTQPFVLARHGGFLPVGADFGPDGAFYLLERAFNGFAFRSRVRQIRLMDKMVVSERILFHTAFGTFDNLEGISAWRGPDGATRLTMISDDNFRFFQRTEFVEYRVLD